MIKWHWETATCTNCNQQIRRAYNSGGVWKHMADDSMTCSIYPVATPGETRGVST